MVCLAAMHAGILTDIRPAELRIRIIETVQEYPCALTEAEDCSANGVEAKSKDEWNRGFTFADNVSTCK